MYESLLIGVVVNHDDLTSSDPLNAPFRPTYVHAQVRDGAISRSVGTRLPRGNSPSFAMAYLWEHIAAQLSNFLRSIPAFTLSLTAMTGIGASRVGAQEKFPVRVSTYVVLHASDTLGTDIVSECQKQIIGSIALGSANAGAHVIWHTHAQRRRTGV